MKLEKEVARILADPSLDNGFIRPPSAAESLEIEAFIAPLKKRIKHYCVIGIGGSALPVKALHSFFCNRAAKNTPKFWILDTTDPESLKAAFHILLRNPSQTFFHFISKSGKTLEVDLIRTRLISELERRMGGQWKEQVAVTVSPGASNPLERWAARNRIRRFRLEPSIGGRFSSFSPVTYLGAAFMGLNLESISRAAGEAARQLEGPCAYGQWLASALRQKRNVAGYFLYGEELSDLGDLILQLFAESLGKSDKGFTPAKFTGPRDQHSLLQLYLDCPKDKSVTLITSRKERDSELGKAFWAAGEGVLASLKRCNVPVWQMEVAERNEQSYAAFVQFFHLAVVALSVLMKVNPFDQPMVEMQKKYTLEFLNSSKT